MGARFSTFLTSLVGIVVISTFGVLSVIAPLAARGSSPATIDQQQPTIDISVGGNVVGGFYEQKLAQIVTAGRTGLLTEIRLPIACESSATVSLQIQGVTGGKPNGTILGSQTYAGADFPSFFPSPGVVSLRSMQLSTPVQLAAGQQFAIVLDADGPGPFDGCGTFQGPAGDSYSGGNLYFDSRPNAVGVWVCVCEFGTSARWDMPFATLMTELADGTPPVIVSTLSSEPNAAGWHRSDVTVSWTTTDPESGIASSSGCSQKTISAETAGTTITCTAANGAGLTSAASVTVRLDKTAPTAECRAIPDQLWPPDHRLVDVAASVQTVDALSGTNGIALVSVTSNEADDGLGDGDLAEDVKGFTIGTADLSGEIRAERSGQGAGRVYTLSYVASDLAGNTTTCAATVLVPHDAR